MLLVLVGLLVCAGVVRWICSPRSRDHRDRYWAARTEEWIRSGISEEAADRRHRLDAALAELRTQGCTRSTDPLGPGSMQFIADGTPIILRALYYPI